MYWCDESYDIWHIGTSLRGLILDASRHVSPRKPHRVTPLWRVAKKTAPSYPFMSFAITRHNMHEEQRTKILTRKRAQCFFTVLCFFGFIVGRSKICNVPRHTCHALISTYVNSLNIKTVDSIICHNPPVARGETHKTHRHRCLWSVLVGEERRDLDGRLVSSLFFGLLSSTSRLVLLPPPLLLLSLARIPHGRISILPDRSKHHIA